MLLTRLLLPALVLTTLLSGSSADVGEAKREIRWGTSAYVEWQAGDAPLIISVPHGGGLQPGELKNRSYGKTVRDGRTAEIGAELSKAVFKATGKVPHLIYCHLHRSKLDANREIVEAAQKDAQAELAWKEYHDFIERARADVNEQYGAGLYVDLHGQSHPENWIEWGYTISGESLSDPKSSGTSSIDHLLRNSELSLSELLRGPTSLGARAQELGYASVPSPAHPDPDGGHYFSGGYSTRRHGSKSGGTIDGVQLELPRRLRMDTKNRERLCRDLATVLVGFLEDHYDLDWVESE